MRHSTGVGVDCTGCGITTGHFEEGGILRCDGCGRFAEATSAYCAAHDVRVDKLTGYDECPRCRQESDRQARIAEQQARRADPTMHNMVDAPTGAAHPGDMGPSDFL